MPERVRMRAVPYLSASAPKKGCPRPQHRFCRAMASAKVERSHPVSASMGNWKKPMAERGPKVSSAISDPLTMISQGRGLRAVVTIELSPFRGWTLEPGPVGAKRILVKFQSAKLIETRLRSRKSERRRGLFRIDRTVTGADSSGTRPATFVG